MHVNYNAEGELNRDGDREKLEWEKGEKNSSVVKNIRIIVLMTPNKS